MPTLHHFINAFFFLFLLTAPVGFQVSPGNEGRAVGRKVGATVGPPSVGLGVGAKVGATVIYVEEVSQHSEDIIADNKLNHCNHNNKQSVGKIVHTIY